MSRYLITLKPIEPFFFGGEYTFGEESENKKANYYAKSRLLPQQTQALGTIKKALLNLSGLLTLRSGGERIDQREYQRAAELVGEAKANGAIQSFSPVMIAYNGDLWLRAPKSFEFRLIETSGKSVINGRTLPLAYALEGFEDKSKLASGWIDKEGKFKDDKDFFKSFAQTGVTKRGDGARENEDKGFYKKTSYTLIGGAAFAFLLEIDREKTKEKINLTKEIVFMGAERSPFLLESVEESRTFDQIIGDRYRKQNDADRIVLLSDSFAPDLAQSAKLIVGEKISRRELERKNGGKVSKGELSYMLSAGSVVYPSDLNKAQEALNNRDLQAIGFNQYQTIKGK